MRTDDRIPCGYRSYSYLRAASDYEEFEFPAEIGRVASRTVQVMPEQEERVQRLLGQEFVISLHDHPTRRPADVTQARAYRRQGRDVTGYAGLSVSGLDLVFDGLMNGTCLITSAAGWKWTDTIHDLGMRLCDFDHQDLVVPVRSVAGARRAKERRQIGIVMTLEACTAIENEIDRLDVLYGLGIRSCGLVYSDGNQAGGGLAEPRDGGLTRFGRRAVRRMNDLGMLVDLAHAGDQTSLDAIGFSNVPTVISHAGARGLWPISRMKPDDVIRACAAGGGLIGIEAAPHTTLSPAHPRHSLDSVMDHFEYCADLVGIDHVGFGPDTNFGDHVAWHGQFARELSTDDEPLPEPEHPEVAFVDGLENPAEAFPNIARWLVVHGYGDEDIAKVLGGNVLRVLDAVWKSGPLRHR
jgi:membrane dipeptidase